VKELSYGINACLNFSFGLFRSWGEWIGETSSDAEPGVPEYIRSGKMQKRPKRLNRAGRTARSLRQIKVWQTSGSMLWLPSLPFMTQQFPDAICSLLHSNVIGEMFPAGGSPPLRASTRLEEIVHDR
jgi:hypothetical protein